jgi:hypothetical protein
MQPKRKEVTWNKADHDRIPDVFSEGAALLLDLERRGILESLGQKARIRRQGGYSGFDIVLLLELYFAAGIPVGLRKFWERAHPVARKLAALAGRKRLPSPASVSRALGAVEPELLRPTSEWLLSEGAGIDAVLSHPSVQTYDGRGQGWHVFDFDPTVTTLRHRALAEADDLPVPRRRSKDLAAPGYSGRKRGEMQFRRGTLQHAGSSAWLQVILGPGNGDGHAELAGALDVVVRTCDRLGHPRSRALLRMDGEFGWVPYLSECRAHGIAPLTRLTRPELFDQPEVMERLRQGSWELVPDSLSGPQRSALDLGLVTVLPGKDTRRADGTPYEPVEVRVVVSRYPRQGKADHGRVLDGWQYEMFVVDVPSDALPAPEAVALYFGRAGQENRFAQEDREIGLDRIFSYHLPGQELAVVVGLWVWNLRLVRGFELETPPVVPPKQEAHVAEPDLRDLAVAPQEPPDRSPSPSESTPPDFASEEPPPAELCPNDSCEPDESALREGACEPSAAGQPQSPSAPAVDGLEEVETASAAAGEDLLETLGRIDWDQVLNNRPGWSWSPATGSLRCPQGRELVLTTVQKNEQSPGRTGIIFCRPAGGCDPCDDRPDCFRSPWPRRSKHAQVAVPTAIADRLRDLLRMRRSSVRSHGPQNAPSPTKKSPTKSPAPRFSVTPLPPVSVELAVLPSLFLPARARHLLRSAAESLSFTVVVSEPPPKPKVALVADSVADVQHRRKTWQEHFELFALDPDARVRITISGSSRLRPMLTGDAQKAAA